MDVAFLLTETVAQMEMLTPMMELPMQPLFRSLRSLILLEVRG